ncbi:MAG: hypothetical protein VSS75_010775 [Candidatus Parabeggiatoa sp.]|nr:hypothetical protein [Candidatus Parabeggiatoa sp.]
MFPLFQRDASRLMLGQASKRVVETRCIASLRKIGGKVFLVL